MTCILLLTYVCQSLCQVPGNRKPGAPHGAARAQGLRGERLEAHRVGSGNNFKQVFLSSALT